MRSFVFKRTGQCWFSCLNNMYTNKIYKSSKVPCYLWLHNQQYCSLNLFFDLFFVVKYYSYKKAAPANIALKDNNKKTPISEITKPAIASPFGILNTPTKDNIRPNNHIIHPRTGIHPINTAIKARMNPATPMPFFC